MAGAIEVAGLYLGLSARTDKLEKDLARARAEAKKFTDGVGRDAKQAADSFGSISTGAEKAARQIAGGLLLASGAVKLFGSENNKVIGDLLNGAAKVSAAYALMGGGKAGGVAAFAIGAIEAFGLYQDFSDKVVREGRMGQKSLRDLAQAGFDAAASLQKSFGEGLLTPLQKMEKQLGDLRARIREVGGIKDDAGHALGDLASPNDLVVKSGARLEELAMRLGELAKLKAALSSLTVSADRAGADEDLRKIADRFKFETEVKKLESEIAGITDSTIPLQQKLAELEERKVLLKHVGRSISADQLLDLDVEIERTRRLLGLSKDAAAANAGREAAKKAEAEWKRAMEETKRASEDAAREIRGYFESILSPAFSGLGDLLYDALTNRGKNAADVLRGTFDNLLRTALNAVTNGLMQTLLGGLGGIFGGGGGGGGSILTSILGGSTGSNPYADFLAGGAQPPALNYIPDIPRLARGGTVSRPMVALLGEGGEDEHVVPESKADAFARSRLGGGVTVTVNSYGEPWETTVERTVAEVRRKMLSSGDMQGAVKKAARGRY